MFAFKKHGNGWNLGIPGEMMLQATQNLDLGQSVCLPADPSKGPRFFLAGLRDLNPCLLMCSGSSMSDQHDYGKTHRFTRDAHGGIVSNDYTRPECFALTILFVTQWTIPTT